MNEVYLTKKANLLQLIFSDSVKLFGPAVFEFTELMVTRFVRPSDWMLPLATGSLLNGIPWLPTRGQRAMMQLMTLEHRTTHHFTVSVMILHVHITSLPAVIKTL